MYEARGYPEDLAGRESERHVEADQSSDKPEPRRDAFLDSRKSEPIHQHADHHHHDHDRNDLRDIIEIPASLKEPTQSVTLHREDTSAPINDRQAKLKP